MTDVACPDGGRCHHKCQPSACFRVRSCGPLSGVYPDNEWPADVRSEHAGSRSFVVDYAEQLEHWEKMLGIMPDSLEMARVNLMVAQAKLAVRETDVAGMLRSMQEMKTAKISPWVSS